MDIFDIIGSRIGIFTSGIKTLTTTKKEDKGLLTNDKNGIVGVMLLLLQNHEHFDIKYVTTICT